MPVGLGMGATQETWDVISLIRAAGIFSISTVAEPIEIMPGPPGTQLARMHVACPSSLVTVLQQKTLEGVLDLLHAFHCH